MRNISSTTPEKGKEALDVKTATDSELLNEYNSIQELWSSCSYDCVGFYSSALLKEMYLRGL